MTRAELGRRMSSAELLAWELYVSEYGPIGPHRADVLAAMQSMYVMKAAAGKKGRRLKLKQFMPQWGRRRSSRPADWRRMRDAFRSAARDAFPEPVSKGPSDG